MRHVIKTLAMLSLCMCGPSHSVEAASVSPVEYGQMLYSGDKQGENARYSARTARLFALCEKRAKRNDSICLDINIFVMGQDTSGPLKDFKVALLKSDKNSAVIAASFINGRRPITVTMNLLKSGSAWVIDDMTGRQTLEGGQSNCAHLIPLLEGRADTCK